MAHTCSCSKHRPPDNYIYTTYTGIHTKLCRLVASSIVLTHSNRLPPQTLPITISLCCLFPGQLSSPHRNLQKKKGATPLNPDPAALAFPCNAVLEKEKERMPDLFASPSRVNAISYENPTERKKEKKSTTEPSLVASPPSQPSPPSHQRARDLSARGAGSPSL